MIVGWRERRPYCVNFGGVYAIVNTTNGKRYIGSTRDLVMRRGQHFVALDLGNHHNLHLQAAYRKYGEAAFEFDVLEHLGDNGLLVEREQLWMDLLKPEYNKRPKASTSLGRTFSAEIKQRMSDAAKRRYATQPHPRSGATFSDESRLKMSASAKRRVAEGRGPDCFLPGHKCSPLAIARGVATRKANALARKSL